MYTSLSTLTRIAISEIGAFGAGTTAVMFVLVDLFPDPNIWEMNTFHTLEFQMPHLQREPPFARYAAAVQVDVRGKRAARDTEVQRVERQHTVMHHDVGRPVGDRQVRGLDDAPRR